MPGPGVTYQYTPPTWGSLTGNPMYDMTAGLFNAPGAPTGGAGPNISLWQGGADPAALYAYNQQYWTNPANHPEAPPVNPPKPWVTPPPPGGNKKIGTVGTGGQQPPPPASGGSLPYSGVPGPSSGTTPGGISEWFPTVPGVPAPPGFPASGGYPTGYGPAGSIGSTGLPPRGQPAPTTPGALPGTNLGLSTGGVNPYLTDPLMASYYGMQNPNFQQSQQDFYGDPELYSAPSVGRSIGGG